MTVSELLQRVRQRVYDGAGAQATAERGTWANHVLKWSRGSRTVRLGIVDGQFMIENRGSVGVVFDGRPIVDEEKAALEAGDYVIARLREPAEVEYLCISGVRKMVTTESYHAYADTIDRQRDSGRPDEPIAITIVTHDGSLDEQLFDSSTISY